RAVPMSRHSSPTSFAAAATRPLARRHRSWQAANRPLHAGPSADGRGRTGSSRSHRARSLLPTIADRGPVTIAKSGEPTPGSPAVGASDLGWVHGIVADRIPDRN